MSVRHGITGFNSALACALDIAQKQNGGTSGLPFGKALNDKSKRMISLGDDETVKNTDVFAGAYTEVFTAFSESPKLIVSISADS